ncbi:hypothetical protein ABFS83_06G049600 [Erythranthe nasuta]
MTNSLDDTEWHECLDWSEDGGVLVPCNDSIFLTVPSRDEVDDAVSSLQQAFKLSSYFSRQPSRKLTGDSDWIDHHSVTICSSSRILQHHNGSNNNSVYDAFHLLQTDTSVQRAVVSLSHDQTVWDAVLKNKDVKKLLGGSTFRAIEQGEDNNNNIDNGTSNDSNPVKDIMSFVFPKDEGKHVPLINKIAISVNNDFQLPSGSSMGEQNGGFMKEENEDKKLKTSLFLTIIVMLVVIVKRFWRLRG